MMEQSKDVPEGAAGHVAVTNDPDPSAPRIRTEAHSVPLILLTVFAVIFSAAASPLPALQRLLRRFILSYAWTRVPLMPAAVRTAYSCNTAAMTSCWLRSVRLATAAMMLASLWKIRRRRVLTTNIESEERKSR